MIAYRSDPQLTARMAARVQHAEPARHLHDRDEYDDRQRRIAWFTQAIPEVLWGPGPLHSVEV